MKKSGNASSTGLDNPISGRDPIAVIGLGCRLPGGVQDWRSFWDVLEGGRDCITETPSDRWNLSKFYTPAGSLPGKTQSRWGGYIDKLDHFDPELFGISPREAASMDPQQRLLLECSFRAIEDAGKRLDQLAARAVAVFVGISSFDYAVAGLSFKDRGVIGAYSNTGGSSSIAANRISYCLDLRGPSVAVDTACSSSLVAVHLACESLWRGESELALAGGVNALILPDFYVAFSQLGVMSPDGRCRTFDAKASGYVRSEGAGVVLLKPLRSALRDKDPVYAVIRGTALNQDGRTPGMTVPSQSAQESLIRTACQRAGIRPSQLQYVEAHGTGTPVGDPIEAAAIGAAVGVGRTSDNACWVGSVKTNIGHLESGAGAASLIKVALALHHRRIPRNLHFHQPNPAIDFASLGLRVPTQTVVWQSQEPRLAGINGFGYGGTNAHVIMEQAPESVAEVFSSRPSAVKISSRSVISQYSKQDKAGPTPPVLLPISARNPAALRQSASQLAKWLTGEGANFHLAEIAGYLAHRRSHLDCRAAVCANDHAGMIDQLQVLALSNEEESKAELTAVQLSSGCAFVCSGQGPQWWAMGRGLLKFSPVYRSVLKRCDAEFARYADWSLMEELEKSESQSRMHQTSIAQPSIFAVQVALAAVWESWGIRPTAIVGHSVGEIAAAYLSGALTWEDACLVAFHRGRTMDLASSQGGMLAVGLTASEVPKWITGLENQVSVAAINGPSSLTIAGASQAIDQLEDRLESANIFCRRLTVEYAFHSPQMEPVRESLLESLGSIRPRATHTRMISTVTGKVIDGRELGADYWWRNVRQTVRFADAMACLAAENYGLLIEIGPHPVLSYSISECFQAAGRSVRTVPSLSRQQSDLQCISKSLGAVYSHGLDIHWSGFYNQPVRKLPVPVYPFQWQRLWNESLESFLMRQSCDAHPLLGQRADHAQTCWHQRIDLKLQSFYADHKVRGSIVYPAAGIVETAIAAANQVVSHTQSASLDKRPSGDSTNNGGLTNKIVPSDCLRLERLKLHNPCLLSTDNPCWMETHYHSSLRQITMAFRSCRVPASSVSSSGLSGTSKSEQPTFEGESESPLQIAQEADATFTSGADSLVHWTPIVTVNLNSQSKTALSSEENLERLKAARSRCTQSFTDKRLYDYCERLGLQYGQSFRGVTGGCWRAGEAVAEVHLPDSIDPSGYILHPALLDSCFHTMIAADACFDHALDGLYLPAEIGELVVDGSVFESAKHGNPTRRVVVHARVLRKTRKKMWCDLDICTPEGANVLTIRGFESQRVQSPSTVEQAADLIYGYRWKRDVEPALSCTKTTSDSRWIVFMDEGGVGKEIVERLRSHNGSVFEVYQANSQVPQVGLPQPSAGGFYQVNPENLDEFKALFTRLANENLSGIIYLWGLDAPDNSVLTAEKLKSSTVLTNVAPLYLVQAWNTVKEGQFGLTDSDDAQDKKREPPRLCLVTRGAQAWDPESVIQPSLHLSSETGDLSSDNDCQLSQGPLVGMGRVIISEYRWLTGKLIDLPPVGIAEKTASGDIDLLLQEILREDAEDEVALRCGCRWLHRFVPLADQPLANHANRDLPIQLRLGQNSGIEELQYATKSRGSIAAGQVEIEVYAAGLNFSDVMKALDLYPGIDDSVVALGAECSGRVSRAPAGSRWKVGDEVIAIAPGAFSTHVIVNEHLVAKKPVNLTHEEAAALPVAFLTGQYALHQCARLKRGESILIHSATGGVGLAAIQLANAAGLRILATAGSEEKRNYLNRLGISHVMDSRTLAFGQQTLEFTGGEGVDAVLNSLPGEAISTGLSTLKLGGRFLEIGKRDIYNDAALGLFPFRKNLSLFAIDLDQLFKHQPAQMGLLLQSLVQRFELGELRPLPTTVFEASETGAAFRFMQQGKHIGKVVVTYQRKPAIVYAGSYDPLRLRGDSTYWIAGGLGGFGLELAKWMAQRGARHLVLSGRSRKLNSDAQSVVDQLTRDGVSVLVLPTDITQPDAVRNALSTIDAQLPPLAGIIHSAMVLEDRLLVDLDRDTLERVLWPKVLGGWNLHEQSCNRDLDFFVVFSSLSSVFGHAGQANYSAANALLDCLAHHRRRLGLPGLVINWGHLGEVGYLAQRTQLGQRLERQGVLSFTVEQAMDCLEYAIQTQATQLSVLRMDWSLWRGLGITGRISPRFADLLENQGPSDISGTSACPDQLRKMPDSQRRIKVSELLRTKIGSLLGLNPTHVREDRAPLEMGLDSLMAVELRNWVEAQLEVNVQISALMRSNSLSELTTHISHSIGQSAPRVSASTTNATGVGATAVETSWAKGSGDGISPELEVIQSNQTEKISSQEAAELLRNLNELSSQEVSQLLSKLM